MKLPCCKQLCLFTSIHVGVVDVLDAFYGILYVPLEKCSLISCVLSDIVITSAIYIDFYTCCSFRPFERRCKFLPTWLNRHFGISSTPVRYLTRQPAAYRSHGIDR